MTSLTYEQYAAWCETQSKVHPGPRVYSCIVTRPTEPAGADEPVPSTLRSEEDRTIVELNHAQVR